MAWLARILLALILAVLAAGLVSKEPWTRALWTAATRPWRLASLPGPTNRSDRILVWLVPLTVLVASRAVHTWFAAPAHLVVTIGAWLLFAATVRLAVRRADPFHLYAALGGVVLLRTVILLAALAARGPGRYWFQFWTDPAARAGYVTLAFAAFGWLFAVTGLVLRDRYGLSRRRVAGALLAAAGVPLAVLGGLVTAIGPERAVTIWNDQLALLPWGLSRILGITVLPGDPAGAGRVDGHGRCGAGGGRCGAVAGT